MERVHPRPGSAKFSPKHSSSAKRFTRIYARDRPFVRSVLLRFGVPARDVDDEVQEVFAFAWRHMEQLVGELDLRPWLYTVAINRARNYRRLCRCRKVCFAGDPPDLARLEVDPEGMIDAYRGFARVMRRFSGKVREVFVRVAVEGQSVKAVAAQLRIPSKTAEARMRIAKASILRTQWRGR